jgi:hypothetical protein
LKLFDPFALDSLKSIVMALAEVCGLNLASKSCAVGSSSLYSADEDYLGAIQSCTETFEIPQNFNVGYCLPFLSVSSECRQV